MSGTRFAVTSLRLDPEVVIRAASFGQTGDEQAPTGQNGATAVFLGLVRARTLDRDVLKLEYQAYEPLALNAFRRIDAEVGSRWPGVTLAVHHRTGTLQVGETSIVIAAAAPHRADAFAACRYTIERVKQIAPIWKREYLVGGTVWVEGATADPDDLAAREEAYRRACA